MKVAYFDCQFGAAGDMLLGALIDAGLDKDAWLKELEKIALPENSFEVKVKQVQRRTLAAKKVDVIIGANAPEEFSLHPKAKQSHGAQQQYAGDHEHGHGVLHGASSGQALSQAVAGGDAKKSGQEPEGAHGHDHGHDHAHGHLHEHQHDQAHEHPHLHDHAHEHEDGHGNGHHHDHDGPAIAMADVQAVIKKSTVSDTAKDFALRVVSRLGSCEGPVHGFAPDAVYFHEVGGVDTIVDIIGFAVGYEMLGIQKSYVSAVPMGSGHVLTAVGYFPVPAPAVALMLAHINAPTLDYEIGFECLTPTGVAILAELCPKWGIMPKFSAVKTVGYGAGSKDSPKHPNVCRVIIGDMVDPG